MPTHTYLFNFDDSRKREIFQCCVFLGGHLFKEMHSHGLGTRPNNLSVSIKHKFNIHNNNFTANYSVALSALHRLHCALITGTHRTITERPWKHDERPEQISEEEPLLSKTNFGVLWRQKFGFPRWNTFLLQRDGEWPSLYTQCKRLVYFVIKGLSRSFTLASYNPAEGDPFIEMNNHCVVVILDFYE